MTNKISAIALLKAVEREGEKIIILCKDPRECASSLKPFSKTSSLNKVHLGTGSEIIFIKMGDNLGLCGYITRCLVIEGKRDKCDPALLNEIVYPLLAVTRNPKEKSMLENLFPGLIEKYGKDDVELIFTED